MVLWTSLYRAIDLKRGTTRYSPTRWEADDPSSPESGHQRGHDWKEVRFAGKIARHYKPKCKCGWKGSVWYSALKHMKEAFYHLHWKEVTRTASIPFEGEIQLTGPKES